MRQIHQRFLEFWGEVFTPMHKVSDFVRSTHGQDGAIVLDIQQGQMFKLNLVGSRILELLESGSSAEQIVDTVSAEFQVRSDRVDKDLTDFLKILTTNKLINDQR